MGKPRNRLYIGFGETPRAHSPTSSEPTPVFCSPFDDQCSLAYFAGHGPVSTRFTNTSELSNIHTTLSCWRILKAKLLCFTRIVSIVETVVLGFQISFLGVINVAGAKSLALMFCFHSLPIYSWPATQHDTSRLSRLRWKGSSGNGSCRSTSTQTPTAPEKAIFFSYVQNYFFSDFYLVVVQKLQEKCNMLSHVIIPQSLVS